jgi:hypothetical protein
MIVGRLVVLGLSSILEKTLGGCMVGNEQYACADKRRCCVTSGRVRKLVFWRSSALF